MSWSDTARDEALEVVRAPSREAGPRRLRITSPARLTLLTFVLCLPATDVLAPSPWLPLPMLCALALGALLLFQPRVLRVQREDLLLGMVVVSCVLPYLWSSRYIGPKTLSHMAAFLTAIGLYYVVVRSWLNHLGRTQDDFQGVFAAVAVALFVVSSYVYAEFVLVNLMGWSADGPLPHLTRPEYLATVLQQTGAGISRARGFAAESGTMALFFELAIFLAYPAIKRLSKGLAATYFAYCLGAFALLFSVGGMASLAAAATIYAILGGPRSTLRTAGVFAALGLLVVVSFPEQSMLFFEQTVLTKLSLLSGTAHAGSSSTRAGIYGGTMALVAEFPLGVGLGIAPSVAEYGGVLHGHVISAGQVSLYGFLAVSGGLVALLAFLAMQAHVLRLAWTLKEHSAPMFMAGTSLYIHHLVVTEYWLPNLWFYFALVMALASAERARNIAGVRAPA